MLIYFLIWQEIANPNMIWVESYELFLFLFKDMWQETETSKKLSIHLKWCIFVGLAHSEWKSGLALLKWEQHPPTHTHVDAQIYT